MKLRGPRLYLFVWPVAAIVSFAATYYSKNAIMDVQSWLIGHSGPGLPTGAYFAAVGSMEVVSVLVTTLLVPVLVGALFQRVSPRPTIRDTFMLAALTFSVLSFFGDLVAMGAVRANPVPSPGSPSILFLMEPVEALQSFALTAVPTGLTAGAFLLLGASLMRTPSSPTTPPTGETGGVMRSCLPWVIAGVLSVIPLCAAAVIAATFNSGVNSYPTFWPLARSILAAATIPISAVLGYLSQRVDFGFSLRRCLVLPTLASFLLYTGFAGIGFGFELFVPTVLSTPTVLFVAASVSLPVALTVGGMMFVASRIALRQAGGVSAAMLTPPP